MSDKPGMAYVMLVCGECDKSYVDTLKLGSGNDFTFDYADSGWMVWYEGSDYDHAIVRCPDHSIAPCGSFIYDKDHAKIECDQRFSHSGMHSHHATNTYWGSTTIRPEDVK